MSRDRPLERGDRVTWGDPLCETGGIGTVEKPGRDVIVQADDGRRYRIDTLRLCLLPRPTRSLSARAYRIARRVEREHREAPGIYLSRAPVEASRRQAEQYRRVAERIVARYRCDDAYLYA